MITPNCTIFVPNFGTGVTTDALGNPVPVEYAPLEIKAWLHEIKDPNTENNPGTDRDGHLLRGHTIGTRPASLKNGQTVTISFTDGRSGRLTIQDRALGGSEMLQQLTGGSQIQGYFVEQVQR